MAESRNVDIKVECLDKSACAQCGAVVDLSGKEAFSVVACPRCGGKFTAPGKVGSLALLKVLGKGQMGVTFKAYDRALGRNVAVKLMRAAGAADRKNIDDFFAEARKMGVLDHPNVATIYNLVEDAENPYIVMELLEGGAMDRHFDKDHPMDEGRALEIGMGVAKALAAANDRGLIHGDVKPGNIMLDDKGRAKLVDFGIARFGGGRMADDEALGTPYYASPEQVLRRPVDFRTDIYSLGATLFHALTGTPPFPGRELKEVLAARLKAPAPDLRTLRADAHPETAALIARMLEARPENRYGSYEELRAAMEAAYAAAAGVPEAPLADAEAPGPSGAWKWLVGAGVAALLAAAGVVGYVLFHQAPSKGGPVVTTSPAGSRPAAVTAKPVFEPAGGMIAQDATVTILCDTAGAAIYYTTDGSEPTEASTRYDKSIQVKPGTRLNARAYAKGRSPSGVAAVVFTEDTTALGSVVPLRTRVTETWNRLKGSVDGGQGFKEKLAAAAGVFANAEEFYRKSAYGPAREGYEQLERMAKELETLDVQRKEAAGARSKATGAIEAVAKASNEPTVVPLVAQAKTTAEQAALEFEAGKFETAAASWAKASQQASDAHRVVAEGAEESYRKKAGGYEAALLAEPEGEMWKVVGPTVESARAAMKAGDYGGATRAWRDAAKGLAGAGAAVRVRKETAAVREKAAGAAELLKAQKFAEAKDAIDEVLKLSPYDPEAWELKQRVASRTSLTLPLEGAAAGTAIKMVRIPAGSFEHGTAGTTRKVAQPFYLAIHEVTLEQYKLYMAAVKAKDPNFKTQAEKVGHLDRDFREIPVLAKSKTPPLSWEAPGFAQTPREPVMLITCDEAEGFCKWAAERTDAKLRLPTETEWEYACRAGTKGRFSFAVPEDLKDYGNYADKQFVTKVLGKPPRPRRTGDDLDDLHAHTAPVGSYKPNPWGLFDMHGNVMEWCSEPEVPKVARVYCAARGGGWASPLVDCECMSRRTPGRKAPSVMIGFRVAVPAADVPEAAFQAGYTPEVPPAPPLPAFLLGGPELAPAPGSATTAKVNKSAAGGGLTVAGAAYASGIGVSSPATVVFAVKKASYRRLVVLAGLETAMKAKASKAGVRCRVLLDETPAASSPILKFDGGPVSWPFDVAIPEGISKVRLVVEDVDPANPGTGVNWVNGGFRIDPR